MNTARAHAAIRALYALTPDIADSARLIELVRAALAGGTRLVQYRNKDAPADLAFEQARALRAVCDEYGAALIVNDHVELALAVGAAGVHLGRDDAGVTAARERLGADKLIGVSCYADIGRARTAARAGADYVAFGSFFPSRVKPGAVRPPAELLTQAKRELAVPVVAIGGITPENARELVAAGADALAVISALFDAPDVAHTAACFRALFEGRP